MATFNKSASGKACCCELKDKNNWTIIGYTKGITKGYIIECDTCKAQWNTKAKYVSELKKASWLK